MELRDVLSWHQRMYNKYKREYDRFPTASSGHKSHFHKKCIEAIEKSMGECNESTKDKYPT